jgi:hypothetical protein
MATIMADPYTLPAIVHALAPDTVVQLLPGVYTQPVEIAGQRGRPDAPIVIRDFDSVIFDGRQTVDDFMPQAEAVARYAEASGLYPGVYPIADQAQLKLRDCAWITLEALRFQRCWPTAVWMTNSTDLVLRNLAIEDSTYAVYATGEGTRWLLLDGWTWLQDPTRHRLWRDTYWKSVHGDKTVPGSGGARAYDGTFFLGHGIAGDLEVKNCTVEHAFNGVHLFNPALSDQCWYLRSSYIKDGAISRFHHFNNAIQFCTTETSVCDPTKSFFGKATGGFTKDWRSLDIRFVNDLSNHRDFPAALRGAGYPIEDGRNSDPLFQEPAAGRFALRPGSPCVANGFPLELARPDGTVWTSRRPLDIGSAQTFPDAFDGLPQVPSRYSAVA